MVLLRLSVIFIFALFGTYKWFAFEANALHHLLPGTWLGALYPALGVQGAQLIATRRGGKYHPSGP
nr:DUF417 family protein [Enterobacter roggenkampii]